MPVGMKAAPEGSSLLAALGAGADHGPLLPLWYVPTEFRREPGFGGEDGQENDR